MTPSPNDTPRVLTAGPLEALFAAGGLRYVKVDGVEVVRRIDMPVRDASWGTVPGTLSNVAVTAAEDGFRLTFAMSHSRGRIAFESEGLIEAKVTESPPQVIVRYERVGRAREAFDANRVGLCVLHPPATSAGRPCVVVHADGSRESGRFPEQVAPGHLFAEVRALTHEPVPGVRVEVRFEGEVFETEDQRNWADGSFKTYGPPLSHPAPYAVDPGRPIRQAVTVRVAGRPGRALAPIAMAQHAGAHVRLPRIGVSVTRSLGLLDREKVARLRELRLDHVRLDLAPQAADLQERLDALAALASALDVPVEFGVHLPSEDAGILRRLSDAVAWRGLRPCRWIIHVDGHPATPDAVVAAACRALGAGWPGVPVGGGTVANFAELNRRRPAPGVGGLLAYAVCPQVHATDDLTLIENLEGIAPTVETARTFAAGRAIVVGPVRLHRQPDPFAKGLGPGGPEPERPDPRQNSPLGAAWTLGAIAALARAGADSATLYEAAGPFGIIDERGPSPAWNVLAELGGLGGTPVDVFTFGSPPVGATLRIHRDGGLLVGFAANLTGEPGTLRWAVPEGAYRAWRSRERSVESADPVTVAAGPDGLTLDLNPWELVRLDEGGFA